MSIRLRPHHLLCTQGYSGKGYSSAFVQNMTRVVNTLRGEPEVAFQLVVGPDDLCAACPRLLSSGQCGAGGCAPGIDEKVVGYFGLREGVYRYRELTAVINAGMTSQMMNDICGTCRWYPVSACRRRVLGGDQAVREQEKVR